MVLSDVRRPGVIILALCGLLERAAHCIKRSATIRLQPTCPALTRPASLFLADEADHDDPLISVSCSSSVNLVPLCSHGIKVGLILPDPP